MGVYAQAADAVSDDDGVHGDEYVEEEDVESLGASSSDVATDDEHADGEPLAARVEQLRAPVLSICAALGGYESRRRDDGQVELVYELGDECLGTWGGRGLTQAACGTCGGSGGRTTWKRAV